MRDFLDQALDGMQKSRGLMRHGSHRITGGGLAGPGTVLGSSSLHAMGLRLTVPSSVRYLNLPTRHCHPIETCLADCDAELIQWVIRLMRAHQEREQVEGEYSDRGKHAVDHSRECRNSLWDSIASLFMPISPWDRIFGQHWTSSAHLAAYGAAAFGIRLGQRTDCPLELFFGQGMKGF
jgi:hypothetical protein